jgi:hypothetical protein
MLCLANWTLKHLKESGRHKVSLGSSDSVNVNTEWTMIHLKEYLSRLSFKNLTSLKSTFFWVVFSSSSWMALQPLWALASFSVSWSIHNRQDSFNVWSAHRKASTATLDGKWPIILLRGPLWAWGSLTCSKFTTWFKQLKVSPGGLVSWIFPSLKIRRPPPDLNPRHSSDEVGTLP